MLVVVMHEQQKVKRGEREESKKGYKMFFPLVDQLAQVTHGMDIRIASTCEVLQVSER